MSYGKEQARWIYKTMNEIRYFEEKVHKIFSDGKIPGFVHLYVGEEAVATGVMSQLEDDDYITSTHRGHGHAIAKGCDLNGMMAEIKNRISHGKGGSMHVAEIDKGMGANGIKWRFWFSNRSRYFYSQPAERKCGCMFLW